MFKDTSRAHPFKKEEEDCICGFPGSFDPV